MRSIAFNPDGRWGLVGGRDPALGTRTAQAWKFITGKPVTPPLGAYGMAHSIVVSPDGAELWQVRITRPSSSGSTWRISPHPMRWMWMTSARSLN